VLGALGASAASLTGEAAATHGALLVLGNGFILTAVLWAATLVFIIDRQPAATAAVLALASVSTLFGLVHSPLATGALFWPWSPSAPLQVAAPLAGAYGALAGLALLSARRVKTR
jgi:AGZA family xanthine/uracil permease-like MFS transporter